MKLAFDLDGTLINCEPRQSSVLRATMAGYGLKVDLKRVWELKRDGASTKGAIKQLGLDQEQARRVVEAWSMMVETPFWLGMDTVISGVRESLHKIRNTGAVLCLITARKRKEWVRPQLVNLGLIGYFDHIVVVPQDDVAKSKAKVLGELTADAYFGDTESDFSACQISGVPFYGLCSGQRCREFLVQTGASLIFSDLSEAIQDYNLLGLENRSSSR